MRGTVRSKAKAAHLLERYPEGSKLTLVEVKSALASGLGSADRVRRSQVKDIVTGEGLAEALEGCDAVAHTASPCWFTAPAPQVWELTSSALADALTVSDPMKDFITPAVEGTLSVLRAAKTAGIKRIVVTSSFAAVTNLAKVNLGDLSGCRASLTLQAQQGGPWRDYTYTAADWNPTTLEQACEPGKPGPFVYR